MKEPEHHIHVIPSLLLKTKLKELQNNINENDVIRLHRAISWVKCKNKENQFKQIYTISIFKTNSNL